MSLRQLAQVQWDLKQKERDIKLKEDNLSVASKT
jgi:hypothetical protein